MIEWLKKTRVLICVGSGGVGKTTVAAALGAEAAMSGRKTLVLTIDPSQRLKTTLGLPESGDIVEITGGQWPQGHYFGAVINAKKTFDEFVRRAVKVAGLPEDSAEKILRNKLYLQLSTTLSGSQEFTALEKLYSSYDSGLYDLVILDTPPTKHAIDFLEAPQKLSALFNEKVAQWLRPGGTTGRRWIQGLLHTGTLQVLKALELLTGSDFMHELRDFFQNLEGWQSRLEDRVTAVHRLLVSDETQFALVTSFDEAKLKEAEYFVREIRKGGYQLAQIYLNRAYPLWLKSAQTWDGSGAPDQPLLRLAKEMLQHQAEREASYSQFAQRMRGLCPVARLPELEDDVADLEGVQTLQKFIQGEP